MIRSGVSVALLLFAAAGTTFADAGQEFETLLDDHWQWRMTNSPVMASALGDRRFNDQWQDDSLAAIAQRHDDTREFLRRTYAIDKEALSSEDQLNYELFRRMLQQDVDEHLFQRHVDSFFVYVQ